MRRFRRPTILEMCVLIAITGMLAALLSDDSATATRRSLKRRARNWKPSHVPSLSDRSLIAADLSLSGEWTTRGRLSGSTFLFAQRPDGAYDAQFSTGGCFGGCELTRIARFSEGAIRLDGAVAEYVPRTYDALYAVRIENVEYLLPAESVPEFERDLASRSDAWQRHVYARAEESSEPVDARENAAESDLHSHSSPQCP